MTQPNLENLSELKKRITISGVTRLELAAKIDVPYGTLSSYLNGFNPMPEHIEKAIEECLVSDK